MRRRGRTAVLLVGLLVATACEPVSHVVEPDAWIESVDQLNELVERGYGWVSTESTERTGDKRWDVFDPGIASNPDLARLTRLHARLIDDTGVRRGWASAPSSAQASLRVAMVWL